MSGPTKVLLVVGAMNRGGIETWLMDVARALDPADIELTFLEHVEEECHFDEEIRRLGHRVTVCPSPRSPGYTLRLRRVLHREGPFDAVHSFVSTFSALPLSVARAAGVPVRVAHSQTDRRSVLAASGPVRRTYARVASAVLVRAMTAGVACSEEASVFLFRRAPAGDPRIRVLPNGIDITRFRDATGVLRTELGVPDGTLLVGHVGRFVPVKNHRHLVDVARVWARRGDAVHLVLVGDGPDRESIARLVSVAGLDDRVTLTGARDDIPEVMAGLDVLVLPSHYEGAPITLVEAQASGVASVVSAAVSTASDIVPGLLERMPPGADAEAWAHRVLEVADRPRVSREAAQQTMAASPWALPEVLRTLREVWSGDVPARQHHRPPAGDRTGTR